MSRSIGAELQTLGLEAEQVDELLAVEPSDVGPATALTVARNVFIPLTTACKYTCTYCGYFDPPGEATLLSPEEVRSILERGAAVGCTEALFTFGDDPDDRYTELYEQLSAYGHQTIHSYLREMCELALDVGLLPHSNPGDQTREQMAKVADVNASMGVMLETTANVDAHTGPRQKSPSERIETIRTAGELGIPFTTGILVGIGEDWRDRARSLLAIRALHEQYGHIQEVIIQNVVPNERSRFARPSTQTMRRVTAMARVALPNDVSVQVPPNLSPTSELLDCGIDDLGGVSPVTDDYINPQHAWPALDNLESLAAEHDVPLVERLPIHDRYLPEHAGTDIDPDDPWLSERIQAALAAPEEAGQRYRDVMADGVIRSEES